MRKSNHIPLWIMGLCILAVAILQVAFDKSTGQAGDSCSTAPPAGCSVFTVAKGDQVIFGGNDDSTRADSWYWVDPPEMENYGVIWIGHSDNVQQGVNERGLAYDANGLPRVDTNPHPERKPVMGSYTSYPLHILHDCATVEEVIEWVKAHQWHSYMHDQMQFADASGDAVIISAGVDGELVFTRKPPGDGFLVSTNFNVANPNNGGYPCPRYETATEQLTELVKQQDEITVEDAASVLEAISTPGGSSWTIESLVADLPHGLVYLYYFHQFDKPVVLNVAEEIANRRPAGPLSKLFPEEVRQEATRRYQRILSNQGLCEQIGKVGISLVLGSLVLMLLVSIRKPRGLRYWLPVTLFLGPLGLLIWLIAGRKPAKRPWQVAMLEAAGHLPPVMLAFQVMLAVFILHPQAQANLAFLILFIFVLPVLLGWLIYQGPLLGMASHRGYLPTLAQRLPVSWIAANLGMGCMMAITARLVAWISTMCSVMQLSVWTLVSFWMTVVIGAYVGFVVILLYEGWAVSRGYRAWSVLAAGEGEVSTPSWRKLWWWILLSFAVLIGGFVINALV